MNSKWNYIACGVSAMVTLICALTHLGFLVIVNGLFTVWNWHIAESRRKYEECELIAKFQESQEKENTND